MYQVTNIIYFYIIIIVLLILFNVWYVTKEQVMKILNKRKKNHYMEKIYIELDNLDDGETVTEEHKNYFQRKLIRTNNLIVFESIIQDLKNHPILERYLIEMSSVFQKLSIFYQKKDSIHKAYFAHILLSLPKITKNDDDLISQTMLDFAIDKSIYCRENAMLFLYKNGSADLVVEALKNMKNRNLYYNTKLLTDDLLKFSGSRKILSTLLLSEFDQFSISIQVAVINYLRFIKEDKTEELYKRYCSHKYDKEVELAMIRYFSKHSYPLMVDEMLRLIKNKDEQNYEYRIVATSCLSYYDSKKARHELINCLCDINWYVRKNAALSLSKMELTKEDTKLLKEIKDPYAKEMLQYVWEEEGKKLYDDSNLDKVKREKQGELKYVSIN